jgi:methionyl aminopeptidase
MESSCYSLIDRRFWQKVSSYLFDGELIKRQIAIEGFYDPLPPGPHLTITIDLMREAGRIVAVTLGRLREAVRPGVSTGDLNRIAERSAHEFGAVPSFLGYHGYPASVCCSINSEIVHGIPADDRLLRDGDIISLDFGAIWQGYHGDSAITVGVGEVSAEAAKLMRVTEEAMWRGFAAAKLGGRVTDISHAVESYIRSQGDYGIIEEYVGHGIGTAMHQPPNVPNYGKPGRGPRLVEGLALAVEPMVVLGGHSTHVLPDDWTVKTDDGSVAAHFEHTFTLTPQGVVLRDLVAE